MKISGNRRLLMMRPSRTQTHCEPWWKLDAATAFAAVVAMIVVVVGFQSAIAVGQGSDSAVASALPADSALSSSTAPAAPKQTKTPPAIAWRAVTGQEIIRFENGDSLFGNLQSVSPRVLEWVHPDAQQPIGFEAGGVWDVRFSGLINENIVAKPDHEIVLRNGNRLAGSILSGSADHLTLAAWYLGNLQIPLSAIEYIHPIQRSGKPAWDGITGLEGWTRGDIDAPGYETGYWNYHSGALYATKMASIARELELPENARIEMDIHWRGNLYLAIALFTDYWYPIKLADQLRQQEPDFGGFYSLYITRSTAGLRSVTKPKVKNFPYRGIPGLTQTNAAHLEILVHRERAEIGLVVNGKPIQPWHDNEGFVGEGGGVRFVHQGQGAIKIMNLRVREWDGIVGETVVNADEIDQDTLAPTDGGLVSGTIDGISEEGVAFRLNDAVKTIGWEKLRYVALAHRESSTPSMIPDLRAEFRKGGTLELQLHRWTPQALEGTHPILGDLILHPAAFDRLEFLRGQ